MITSETAELLTLISKKSTNNKDDVAIWAKKPAHRKITLNDAIEDGLICSRTAFGEQFVDIQTPIGDPFDLPYHLALTTKGILALEDYSRLQIELESRANEEKRAEREEKRSKTALAFSAAALVFSLISLILDFVTRL